VDARAQETGRTGPFSPADDLGKTGSKEKKARAMSGLFRSTLWPAMRWPLLRRCRPGWSHCVPALASSLWRSALCRWRRKNFRIGSAADIHPDIRHVL
jgi:hypothetical protein